MKSLAVWSSKRHAIEEPVGRVDNQASDDETRQLLSGIADTLCASIVESRALILLRQQSHGIREWARKQNHELETAYECNLSSVRERLVKGVSDNLLPLLNRHIEQKSLEDFMSAIEVQTRDMVAAVVRVSSPGSLTELITLELKKRSIDAVVTGESERELVANFGETRIESRLGPITSKVEDLLSNA